jgi:hypothetical protein
VFFALRFTPRATYPGWAATRWLLALEYPGCTPEWFDRQPIEDVEIALAVLNGRSKARE